MRFVLAMMLGLATTGARAADIGYCEGRAVEVRQYLSQAEAAKNNPPMAKLHLGMAEMYLATMQPQTCAPRPDIEARYFALRRMYPPER